VLTDKLLFLFLHLIYLFLFVPFTIAALFIFPPLPLFPPPPPSPSRCHHRAQIYQCGAGYFEALIAALVALIAGCFFANFFATASAATVGSVASGLAVPRLVPSGLVVAMGTLGAVIMPHNLYLHSGLVKTRAASDASFDRTNADAVAEANTYSAIESGIALLTSFFVNLAVVGTFAHFFFSAECSQGLSTPMACVPLDPNHAGSTALDSFSNLGHALACSNDAIPQGVEARCAEIGLDGAGAALESTIGALGKTTWAVGLLAAGQASTMSTTFAGQVVMDGFLSLRLSPWQRASVTRLAALGPSLSIAIFTSDHATTRNAINEWLNILQSIQLPFAIIPVLTFTASAAIMNVRNTDHGSSSSGSGTGHANGNRFRNRGVMLFLALSLTALVLGANVFLVHDFLATHPAGGWAATLAAAGLGLAYFAFVLHLARTGVQYAQGKLLPPPPPASPPLPSSLAPSSPSTPWPCGGAQGRSLTQQELSGQSSVYPPARLVVALPAMPGISSTSSHPQRELEDGHPPVHGGSIGDITAIHGRGYGAVKSQP